MLIGGGVAVLVLIVVITLCVVLLKSKVCLLKIKKTVHRKVKASLMKIT